MVALTSVDMLIVDDFALEPMTKGAQHLVGACKAHVIAMTAGDVTEGLRDEGLADTDGPEHDHVAMGRRAPN